MNRDCSHNVSPGGGATPPTMTSPTSPSAWQETTWMILEVRMRASNADRDDRRIGLGASAADWREIGTAAPLLPPRRSAYIARQPPLFAPARRRRHFMAKPRTLYDKIWDDHVIETTSGTRASSISTAISSTR